MTRPYLGKSGGDHSCEGGRGRRALAEGDAGSEESRDAAGGSPRGGPPEKAPPSRIATAGAAANAIGPRAAAGLGLAPAGTPVDIAAAAPWIDSWRDSLSSEFTRARPDAVGGACTTEESGTDGPSDAAELLFADLLLLFAELSLEEVFETTPIPAATAINAKHATAQTAVALGLGFFGTTPGICDTSVPWTESTRGLGVTFVGLSATPVSDAPSPRPVRSGYFASRLEPNAVSAIASSRTFG
jgi:hypothetical protein